MPISYDPQSKKITAEQYSLQMHPDRPFLTLADASGQALADLFPYSSVHSTHGLDDTTQVSDWQVTEADDEIWLCCSAKSSVWKSKDYWFRCAPDCFQYGVEVHGQGSLTEADYFGGFFSASLRWGSGYYESGSAFLEGFTPEPNTREHIFFPPSSSERIDLTGVPIPGRDGWFFTPPPFCFCFKTQSGWMSAGVEAHPGQNRFSDYHYRAGDRWFHLSLSYDGYTRVDGSYALPAIGFYFAADPYAALQLHVESMQAQSLLPAPHKAEPAQWWQAPIFCGWGAQCNLAARAKGWAPEFATQENYERFMSELDQHAVHPGTVVIDDKWQLHYGENSVDTQKWPDLAGFIRARHEHGQKVLLWLKFWDPDGLPADECVTNASGAVVAADPTNPKFIARFQESLRIMLSAEGLDADGFKVDFSARIPSGPGMRLAGDVWGLELMRVMLELLYSGAKAVKKDALVITHTPHPYLAPYLDMIRLNDINTGKDVIAAMTHRQKVARIACPQALIDTDNWPITNKADWLTYLDLQAELGVPALYYTTHIDATGEALEPADYARLRLLWKTYAEKDKR